MSTENLAIFAMHSLLAILWQAWWVKMGAIVAVMGTMFIFFKLRINALNGSNADLKRQVSERSELLDHAVDKEKKAREVASQANRTKSLLLSRINHEIRTPLNGILGMSSLLNDTSLSEEQQDYNSTIKECGDNLLKIVNDILLNDILDYSKMESGKMDLEQKDFDLENCIEDVLEVFGDKAAKKGLELIYFLAEDVPTQIIGDNLRLRQVLMNLVENAVRFTDDGEIFIKVHKVAALGGNNVELAFEVRDTGIGIKQDKLKSLSSDMPRQTLSIDPNAGGVGLIISKTLVELMAGTVKIESEVGKGTSVVFTIQTSTSLQAIHSTNTQGSTAFLEKKKVLIVEDNVTHGLVLKEQLERWKLLPTVVSSGQQALQVLSEVNDIELLVTDMFLQDMKGTELASQVRKDHRQLPLILLAPANNEESKHYSEFFNGVVYKPLRKHLLNKQIVSCLRNPSKPLGKDQQSATKLSDKFSEQFPLRILIAEDNITNQKLAMKVLGKLGYKPDIAQNGKEVLEIVSNKNYDLIFMDVQMPEMDGLEASRMIRLCLSTQPVIIAMTANTLQGDREACLKAGMDDYISKPINLDELVEALEKWSYQIKEKK